MFESLLRTVWANSWRRARSGSRAWTVVAVATGGIRLLRHFARDKDDVLYRTELKAGDRFEITATRPVPKHGKPGRKK
jgi:hypothetical protein